MDMVNVYPDKENERIGKPVVKESDVDKVKRNLSMPLMPRNQLENNNVRKAQTPSIVIAERKGVNSPVTELANNFTELAAHEVSCNNTPKRRLSLASSAGSPSPEIICQPPSLTSSLKSTSSISSNDLDLSNSGSASKPMSISFVPAANTRRYQRSSSSLRRHHSMPFGGVMNEASPQLGWRNTGYKHHTISPLAQSSAPIQPPASFYLGGTDETSVDSHDSGIGREDRFTFAVPPERAQKANEFSPIQCAEIKKDKMVIGSPELHEATAQDSSDSPLLAHRLCSHSADDDDGFSDLDDLEKQCEETTIPANIADILTGKMETNSSTSSSVVRPRKISPPTTNFRGTLFRSPSMPQQIGSSLGYDIRRRVMCGNKRSEPPNDNNTPTGAIKKRRALVSDGIMPPVPCKLRDSVGNSAHRLSRTRSMVESRVAFTQSTNGSEGQTGDGRDCCLPLVKGKKPDLNNISHDTMAKILNNEFEDKLASYTIIDCRYPYEYKGGHIKGAENIYTKEELYSKFIANYSPSSNSPEDKRHILIFHCEFSSERAPRLSRFLRNHDREINSEHYPSLYHPELYLLESGYKLFYEHHKDLCEPNSYTPMLHPDHGDDLKKFRAKSKSWSGEEKKGGFRPGLRRY